VRCGLAADEEDPDLQSEIAFETVDGADFDYANDRELQAAARRQKTELEEREHQKSLQ